MRRATPEKSESLTTYFDFYPRSPCGERLLLLVHYFSQSQISIHALLAESDSLNINGPLKAGHFYPRSPCGERPNNQQGQQARHDFYPRSPCGERLDKIPDQSKIHKFLSTLSLRRATNKISTIRITREDFYPRSPCGERRYLIRAR